MTTGFSRSGPASRAKGRPAPVAWSPVVLAACALALAACAPTSGPPLPPPPPPPDQAARPLDWRGIITAVDRDRHSRRDAAWRKALEQAGRLPGSGNLTALGDLIAPDAALTDPAPPTGAYRCRTVKLGTQDDDGSGESLGYVVYGWFACRIEQTPKGLKFVKVTGSQRPSGLLFPENDRSMVMLGSMALGGEAPANSYGMTPDRDLSAVLERIGPARWRLVIPWPRDESTLDLIELVPA